MTKLYMAVTPDALELPLYVAESCKELAMAYGVSQFTVLSAISHGQTGVNRGAKFVRVIIDDDEE